MRIPQQITQGDSLSWSDSETNHLGKNISSTDYILKYALRGSTSLDLTGEAEGSGWVTSITKVQSAALSPGFYYWQAFVEKGTDEKITLGTGRVEILKDLSAVSGVFDGRTQNRKDLDAVQAAIRAMISGGAVQEYSIGNRSFKKMTLSDLRVLESKLKFDVNQEERAQKIKDGHGDPNSLYVRF